MTPQAAIAMLDRQLASNGQDVTLSRTVAGAPAVVVVRCAVKNGDSLQTQDPFGKSQGSFKLIMSPTQIEATGWPGGTPVGGFDQRIPINQDRAIINGHIRTIQVAIGIYMANTLVRIEALAVG